MHAFLTQYSKFIDVETTENTENIASIKFDIKKEYYLDVIRILYIYQAVNIVLWLTNKVTCVKGGIRGIHWKLIMIGLWAISFVYKMDNLPRIKYDESGIKGSLQGMFSLDVKPFVFVVES